MRNTLLCGAIFLTACATGERSAVPRDWRPLTTTPDFVLHYDDLSARYTSGILTIRVRGVPVRSADFAWEESTYMIDCGTMKLAMTEEKTFNASGATIGYRSATTPYYQTIARDSQLAKFMVEGCRRYRDRG